MYFTIRQTLNHLSYSEYKTLKYLCHISKNLANETIYEINKEYQLTKTCLSYGYAEKRVKGINRKILQSNMAQHIIKYICDMFISFYRLRKQVSNKEYSGNVNPPKYLDKNGYFILVMQDIPKKIKSKGYFDIPYSERFKKNHPKIRIKTPPILKDKKIKEIRIVPRYNARMFEVHYSYELQKEQVNLDYTKALAIDLGVTNFATCVSTEGASFIIDGRKIKSYNHWVNKYKAKLESIKAKQGLGKKQTNRQYKVSLKRDNRIKDYIGKSCRYIVKYCLLNSIGHIVLGYNDSLQRGINLGKANNQILSEMPYGEFKYRLGYLCTRYNIKFIIQDESFTSIASFWDKDELPTYDKNKDSTQYIFSGKRIKRGLYKTSTGKLLNSDLNGALNILRKSNVVIDAVNNLYSMGELNPPIRVKLHK